MFFPSHKMEYCILSISYGHYYKTSNVNSRKKKKQWKTTTIVIFQAMEAGFQC